jgi:hypothetical protein
MTVDSRFLGFWITDNGLAQIAQDPQSGDGFAYLGGDTPIAYALPDSNTLAYPLGRRLWRRVGSSSAATVVGHWRHDLDPAEPGDLGEDMIFRADGSYVDYWDGEGIYYNGTCVLTEDSSGLYITTSEYRLRLQSTLNTYTTTSVDGSIETGVFEFGVNAAGKETVTFASPARPNPANTWVRP